MLLYKNTHLYLDSPSHQCNSFLGILETKKCDIPPQKFGWMHHKKDQANGFILAPDIPGLGVFFQHLITKIVDLNFEPVKLYHLRPSDKTANNRKPTSSGWDTKNNQKISDIIRKHYLTVCAWMPPLPKTWHGSREEKVAASKKRQHCLCRVPSTSTDLTWREHIPHDSLFDSGIRIRIKQWGNYAI